MLSRTAMDVNTAPRRSRNERAKHVSSVRARMQLTATALRNVDLPDAFEPVKSAPRTNDALFGTGSSRSGWHRSVKDTSASCVYSGRHQCGSVPRKSAVPAATSSPPSARRSLRLSSARVSKRRTT